MSAFISIWRDVWGWVPVGALACAALLVLDGWLDNRRDERRAAAAAAKRQQAATQCPWCDDPDVTDSERCNCGKRCAVGFCKAGVKRLPPVPYGTVTDEAERIAREAAGG